MQINSINSSIGQTRNQNASFGQKYPFRDVMSIMSACYAHNTESVNKTCASIVKKDVGVDAASQRANFNKARNFLMNKYSNLMKTAAEFAQAIDKENSQHFKIPKNRMDEIVSAQEKKFGSHTIDIEVE